MTKPKLDQGVDYERGFVDGMQYQMQSSVDKAVKALTQPEQEAIGDTAGRCSGKTENIGCLGMPVNVLVTPPQRTWVGLSREDCYQVRERESDAFMYGVAWAEAKLKQKNTRGQE